MKDQHESGLDTDRGTRRARILWRDEDSGELLWLVLTGTHEFLEELGHAGYDLRRLPDPPQPTASRLTPNAA
ncbi:MAG: hypothetical protein NTY35_08230 [Planctomycetota bacterium]|nr:hypothetical protein [Planctomycetota bacterium]